MCFDFIWVISWAVIFFRPLARHHLDVIFCLFRGFVGLCGLVSIRIRIDILIHIGFAYHPKNVLFILSACIFRRLFFRSIGAIAIFGTYVILI